MRRFKQLSRADRLKLEALLKAGHGKQEIADQIGVHVSTIYREIKRGTYTHTNSDLTEEERYSPDIAEDKYQQNLRDKGPDLKIGKDHRLAEYIETKIAEDGYSPGAVLGERRPNRHLGQCLQQRCGAVCIPLWGYDGHGGAGCLCSVQRL